MDDPVVGTNMPNVATEPRPAPDPVTAAPRPAGRLAFLDVLRGIAAMSVVLYHFGNTAPVGTEAFYFVSHTVLNFGGFGVFLFFMVSGFIIPASLERHGSVGAFWISRLFRIFPLFWAVSLAVLLFGQLGWGPVSPYVYSNWPYALVGNVTVLARHLGAPFLIGPAWTLPYELCFYLLTTVLFVTRIGRASRAIALAAAGGVLLAGNWLVGPAALTPWVTGIRGYHGNPVRVAVIALLAAAGAALLARSRTAALYAAAAALVAVPVLLNRPDALHQAGVYLIVMFTGTVVHRIWSGELSPRAGWTVVAVNLLACCTAFALYSPTWHAPSGQLGESPLTRSWGLFVVFGLFALSVTVARSPRGAGLRWPAGLTWLGRISYSLYLTHWVVMNVMPPVPDSIPGYRVLTFVVWMAITLVVSHLTYRYLEKPAMDLGHRVSRWWRQRRAAPGWAAVALRLPTPRLDPDGQTGPAAGEALCGGGAGSRTPRAAGADRSSRSGSSTESTAATSRSSATPPSGPVTPA
jgi:peptidoglycan/LPS O-acetylase OafA/YrhL